MGLAAVLMPDVERKNQSLLQAQFLALARSLFSTHGCGVIGRTHYSAPGILRLARLHFPRLTILTGCRLIYDTIDLSSRGCLRIDDRCTPAYSDV